MPKKSRTPDRFTPPKNANPKGDKLTSKHNKALAHRGPERRQASKGRG
jgi:hypothetical protein